MYKTTKHMNNLEWLYSHLAPYRKWIIFNLSTVFILFTVNLVRAYFMQWLVDDALSGITEHLSFCIAGLLITVMVGVAANYYGKQAAGQYTFRTIKDLKQKMAEHVSSLPIKTIETDRTGEIFSVFSNEVSDLQKFINTVLPDYIYQPLMFVGASILMITINYKLLLVSLVWLPLGLYLVSILSQRLKKYKTKSYEANGELNNVLNDAISVAMQTKAYNLQDYFYRKYDLWVQEKERADLRGKKVFYTFLLPFFVLCNFMPTALCILYGGQLAFQGEIKPGELVVFIQLLDYVVKPLKSASGLLARFQENNVCIQRIRRILDAPTERQDGSDVVEKKDEQAIVFENVDFSYNEDSQVLSSINFSIGCGQRVGLVGASGSGKSTILNLICGFHEADSGTLLLYGNHIRDLSLKAIRSQLAWVSQDVYLFAGTIAQNIACGKENIPMDQIIKAAKQADAHNFIMEMPDGYNSRVSERGASLSGGQRQRLSIARAFIKDAPILLLDEPTSSLDNRSEAVIQNSINELMEGKTVIIIAHRLTTIKNADQIIVLNNGQIIDKGTHEELFARQGDYRRLYQTQFS